MDCGPFLIEKFDEDSVAEEQMNSKEMEDKNDERACEGTNIFIDAVEHNDGDDGYEWMFSNGTIEKSGQGSMGVRDEEKVQSLNGRMFKATLTALVMALKKVEICGLTKEITVNTRRKDVIGAMNPQRLRTLNRKTNSNALIILECHAIMNCVALRGALVALKQVIAKRSERNKRNGKEICWFTPRNFRRWLQLE